MMASPNEDPPGDDPISARYVWDPETMAEGLSAHAKQSSTWPRRVAIGFATIVYVGGSIALPLVLILSRFSDPTTRRNAVFALLFIVPAWIVVFALTRRQTILKWQCRRVFRSVPGGSTPIEWSVDSRELANRTNLAATTFLWPAFLKVVETPGGFILYQNPKFINYIPAYAFLSGREMGRFRDLARSQARKFEVFGECRYAGKPEPLPVDEL